MRRSVLISAAVLAALGLSGSIARAGATDDFHLVDQACTVNKDAGTATFRLNFAQPPRFTQSPTGGAGNQTDSFQIEIDADHNTFDHPIAFDEIDSVVRGAEISTGSGIPVRDREGDGGGEQSGGWGPVRAVVPFDLDGSTLTFTTGLSTIGDQDGKFRYRVITMQDGSLTSEVNAAIIPVPAALGGGMLLLGGAGAAHRLRKRTFC